MYQQRSVQRRGSLLGREPFPRVVLCQSKDDLQNVVRYVLVLIELMRKDKRVELQPLLAFMHQQLVQADPKAVDVAFVANDFAAFQQFRGAIAAGPADGKIIHFAFQIIRPRQPEICQKKLGRCTACFHKDVFRFDIPVQRLFFFHFLDGFCDGLQRGEHGRSAFSLLKLFEIFRQGLKVFHSDEEQPVIAIRIRESKFCRVINLHAAARFRHAPGVFHLISAPPAKVFTQFRRFRTGAAGNLERFDPAAG